MPGTTAKRLVSVVGARPQFVKAFPLSKAIAATGGMEEIMVHTGQHFDDNMSAIFFDEFAMAPPRYHFDIHSGAHGDMSGRMLAAIEQVLLDEKPDFVLVYGDTNSTLAGALAAAKLHIPVAHVESGMRSFNRRMPEEINRVVADHLSTVLFCSTSVAAANLANEGIVHDVYKTGDLMYDAAVLCGPVAAKHSRILDSLGLSPRSYSVATVHRAGNTDERMALTRVMDYLALEAEKAPLVLVLHPRTRQAFVNAGIDLSHTAIRAIAPVGYLDMLQLVRHATTIFTDSGGLQKEAYFHRVPCVTLRSETEWVETIENGWNRLWEVADYRWRRDIEEYGDGTAADDIAAILVARLG